MTEAAQIVTFRLAGPADGDAVARLHAASWRAHYRGSLTDHYLDGPIEAERRATWAARLSSPAPNQIVLLAEAGEGLVGFLCAFVDQDPTWGTLIDNLHVTVARKGGGIGRALMHEIAGRLDDGHAAHHALDEAAPGRGVHLFVKAANVAAQGFYARIGGTPAGEEAHDGPDGSRSLAIRILWPSPRALRDATAPASLSTFTKPPD